MEPEGSLPYSQMPATCPYPEPARSIPYPSSHFLKIQDLNIPSTKSHAPLSFSRSYQNISPNPMFCLWIFRNEVRFNCEQLLAPRPTPKLEAHPLSVVHDCLFNIFAATLHIAGRSSISNQKTRHAVLTGTHLSHGVTLTSTSIK